MYSRAMAIGLIAACLGVAPAQAQDAGAEGEPATDAEQPPSEEMEQPAEETTSEAPAAAPVTDTGPDLAELRAALDTLMDDMVSARGRIASLGKALFRTRLSLWVDNRADEQKLTALQLWVDGAPVYDGDGKELRIGQSVRLFDGHAAPGKHQLRVVFAQRSVENADYTYESAQTFVIEVREETNTEVTVRLDDDSDIAEELPEGDEGEYDVRTRVRVDPIPLEK